MKLLRTNCAVTQLTIICTHVFRPLLIIPDAQIWEVQRGGSCCSSVIQLDNDHPRSWLLPPSCKNMVSESCNYADVPSPASTSMDAEKGAEYGQLPVSSDSASTMTKSENQPIDISSKRFQDKEEGMDSFYAWVVCIASAFVQLLVIGDIFCFGIFLSTYVDKFDEETQASVAFIGSIALCTTFFLAIFTGAAADYFGNHIIICIGALLIGAGLTLASFSTKLWHLYLTQGLLAGSGYSAAYISAITIVAQWFKKSRGFAVGIAVAGGGLGQFVMAQVVGALIIRLGWRSALRYMAVINVAVMIPVALFVRRRLPYSRRFLNIQMDLALFKDRNFMLLSWAYMLFIFGYLVPTTFLFIYSKKHGVPKQDAVFILSMYGVSNLAGRLFFGKLGSSEKLRVILIRMCACMGGIITSCWLQCKTYDTLLTYAFLQGFVGGGVVALIPAIGADIVGVAKVSSFLGILYTISAFSDLASPPIGGLLFDNFDNYRPTIMLSSVAQFCSMLLFLFIDISGYDNSRAQALKRGQHAHEDLPSVPKIVDAEQEQQLVPLDDEDEAEVDGINSNGRENDEEKGIALTTINVQTEERNY